ncbi:serine hydrolase domain-containing protein [Sphingomonas sp. CJ20]
MNRRAVLAGLAACALPRTALARSSTAPAISGLRDGLAAMLAAGTIPNAQVAIHRHGAPLATFGMGMLDRERGQALPDDALFRLFSMSKPITSVAAMLLVEDGVLALDMPAARFLPELAGLRVHAGGADDRTVTAERPVTIAHLLTHSAGFTYPFMGDGPVQRYYRAHGVQRTTAVGRKAGDAPPAETLDALVARLGEAPLLHQPGARFSYGYSTTVLGAVIERVAAMPLEDFLARRVFQPLDMRDTAFVVDSARLDRFGTLYTATQAGIAPVETAAASEYRDTTRLRDGGGALVATLRDYAHFAAMLANGGQWRGRRILRPETVQAMLTTRLRTGGTGVEDTGFGYGFAIGDAHSESIGGPPAGTASWAGSGNSYFVVDPASGTSIVLMTSVLTPPPFDARKEALRMLANRALLALSR